jgi:hypothetical protein
MKWIAVALSALLTLGLACGSDDETGSSSSGAGAGTGAGTGTGTGAGGTGTGGTAGSGGMPDLSLQGASCPATGCPAPLECVSYCGFAGCGGNGGTLSSCEIPCNVDNGDADCPAGQTCFSVADGPGEVCQPS